jgi:DNA polymerase III subunit beta
MMKLTAKRETLLEPLQAVSGVVERRQTMPILANILLVAKDGQLSVTATDLEVELVASTELAVEAEGEITVPGRKLLDICKALPEGANIKMALDGDRVTLRAGRSRFTLSTLPASEFPTIDEVAGQQRIKLGQSDLKRLLDKTQFSMAHQDVRYYLNGLLIEAKNGELRAVATDGHRLALAEMKTEVEGEIQVIVPRKGVLELSRLLHGDGEVSVAIGTNHIQVELDGIRFTSKLIDGRFPDYDRVIPQDGEILKVDRPLVREALQRAAILSNEKYRGIRLLVSENTLKIQAHNPEQEEAEEEVEVTYTGPDVEIGFNVNYLLDALQAVDSDEVLISVTDANSSCLISVADDDDCRYVVMPMRL